MMSIKSKRLFYDGWKVNYYLLVSRCHTTVLQLRGRLIQMDRRPSLQLLRAAIPYADLSSHAHGAKCWFLLTIAPAPGMVEAEINGGCPMGCGSNCWWLCPTSIIDSSHTHTSIQNCRRAQTVQFSVVVNLTNSVSRPSTFLSQFVNRRSTFFILEKAWNLRLDLSHGRDRLLTFKPWPTANHTMTMCISQIHWTFSQTFAAAIASRDLRICRCRIENQIITAGRWYS